MWKHMARIIGEVRPQYVFVENSPMLTTRGLGVVLADLSSLGFNAKWGVVSAADVGANHQRERIWVRAKQRNIFSHTKTGKSSEWIDISGIDGRNQEMANTKNERDVWRDWIVGFAQQKHNGTGSKANGCGEWWAIEPNVGRVANGVAARVDRLKAIGNGQVPLCAATAWELLK
jgi:DNA (cytosine-5)-methyltransferase 1